MVSIAEILHNLGRAWRHGRRAVSLLLRAETRHCRLEISRDHKGQLALPQHFCCVLQCFMNILSLKIRIGGEYIRFGHTISNHSHHRSDWDAQAANASNPVHLPWIHGYPLKSHRVSPAHNRTTLLRLRRTGNEMIQAVVTQRMPAFHTQRNAEAGAESGVTTSCRAFRAIAFRQSPSAQFLRPPCLFIADLMQIAVVDAAQRHCDLIADLERLPGPSSRRARARSPVVSRTSIWAERRPLLAKVVMASSDLNNFLEGLGRSQRRPRCGHCPARNAS